MFDDPNMAKGNELCDKIVVLEMLREAQEYQSAGMLTNFVGAEAAAKQNLSESKFSADQAIENVSRQEFQPHAMFADPNMAKGNVFKVFIY